MQMTILTIFLFVVLAILLFWLLNTSKKLQSANNILQDENVNLRDEKVRLQTENELLKKKEDDLSNLANAVFMKHKEVLQQETHSKLNETTKPIVDMVNRYSQEIRAYQEENKKISFNVTKSMEVQNAAQKTAQSLENALKGHIKFQGDVGELYLKQVLESAGMQEGIHFERQDTLTSDEVKGRPDFYIKTPDDKKIIIDAKTSFDSFYGYMNATEKQEKINHLKSLEQSVRNHIKELKKYHDLNDIVAVLMYVPQTAINSLLISELSNVFQYASENNIYIVDPLSLSAFCALINHGYKMEKQNKNLENIFKISEDIASKAINIVNSVESVQLKFNKEMESINTDISGRNGIKSKLEKLTDMGSSTKKTLKNTTYIQGDFEEF